jgi:hypothetical protein
VALLVRIFLVLGTSSRLERAYPNIFIFAQWEPECWARAGSYRQHSGEAILDESDFVIIGQDVPLIVASQAK